MVIAISNLRVKYDLFYSGEIAEGLPPFGLPPFRTVSHNVSQSFVDMASIYGTTVLSIPFVSFLETVSTAKAFCKYMCLQIAIVVRSLFIILSSVLRLDLIFMDPCIVVWLSRNSNKMQLCNRIYYSKVYWRLNMFRAAHRSLSGALNCICSLWFIYCNKVKDFVYITHSTYYNITIVFLR